MSQNAEQQAPLRITVSEVKSLLDQGKSRKEIADHFGKTQAEMQRMVWSHPKLKNLKAKKQYTGIELMDDEETLVAENVVEEVSTTVANEVTAEEPVATEEQAPVAQDTVNQDWN
jgi:uncharacterized membrane-anchored protein YhcB (DUF1043 family)